MWSRVLAVGFLPLATVLLISGAFPGSVPAYAANPTLLGPSSTKIMVSGDSISEGIDGDYTWRYRLAMELRRQGVSSTVNLVGPKIDPKGGFHNYLGGRRWDYDHNSTAGTTLNFQTTMIKDHVEQFQPDILISYLGTNDFLDILRANPGASPGTLLPLYRARITRVMADWRVYIDAAREAKPSVRFVLGELIAPRVPLEIRTEYNEQLDALATELSTLQPRVALAQLDGQIWQSPKYLYDAVHPTPTGETYLAQKFAESLNVVSNDLLPAFPAIQRAFVAWNPLLAARAQVIGAKVRLNWAYTVKYHRANKMRVRILTVRTGKVRTLPFRVATTWTSKPLAPGNYRISLQASRGAMLSTWSKPITVKIKQAPRRS